MKVAIPGATGLIGRLLVQSLVRRGQEPVVLTRDPSRVSGDMAGLDIRSWSAYSDLDPAAFEGVDAVVNLSGEPIVSGRWTAEKKRRIRESRVKGNSAIVSALSMLDPRPGILLTGSAVGYYGSRGDDPLVESERNGSDFLASVCGDLEAEAEKAGALGIRVIRIRTGVVLSARGGALSKMLTPFRMGIGGRIGSGRQWFSWIHERDIVGAIIFLLENPEISGAVNVVSPGALRNSDFTQSLGRALSRPAIVPIPLIALRLLFGEMAGVLTFSIRAVPDKLRDAGYEFEYDEIDAALAECVKR
jgi:uncharacterized protein (TIGR01777 family)